MIIKKCLGVENYCKLEKLTEDLVGILENTGNKVMIIDIEKAFNSKNLKGKSGLIKIELGPNRSLKPVSPRVKFGTLISKR